MTVIEVIGAHKGYRSRGRPPQKALDGLDLVVGTGGVHGFLGPNGSGKTTTIRILLGLVRADAGTLHLLGQPVPQALPEVIGHVGALVETPLFFPSFSGRLNLRLLADTAGLPATRVEECLELVGLRDRAGDRFKGYSLGMKQRLGIAAALMKRPRLLILDEPGNGLDPAGIREVRELVIALGRSGHTTVFLSSHQLSEVQQVCDHVSILARGRCVATGPVAQVLAGGGTGDVRVRVPDGRQARQVLEAAGFTVSDSDDGDGKGGDGGGALRVHGVPDPAAVTRALVAEQIYLSELSPISVDLESVFLELTQEQPS